ncbi:bifunctional helix-turn-helix transcriptional regulator/GNAT family N-acetyltransferase [Flavobacterium anhuiense]|uniref:bifunctional helix-turn-helix transcriptional regulator/GNAT family N-acetyltransferase n=1 Tax=Flavobacterium anhuiense TaxID=459526 RepID=UPI002025ECB5|nr:bifunctional helix-turn-helix transcriptional regulator/GNAT family N-acetyltransferase [Flavobacterium anhuiense]URM38799.1 bifunctional helix-turn-helix transcriptional regulator/GNAT family N-acetyltransferase [Flavobacterium anhuiense]
MNTTTSKIRNFNRFYTAHLDILSQHYLDSEYSLTEIRILYEISESKIITAQKITEILNLDKGYLSRILKRFLKENLIEKVISTKDKRAFNIKLTNSGNELLSVLNDKSENKIESEIEKLNSAEKEILVDSMNTVRNLLTENKIAREDITYRHEITPGDIGYIIHLHGAIYGKEYHFSTDFEKYVIKTFYDFLEKYSPKNDRIWMAEYNNKIVGCVAIVHQPNEEAQLRWFLLDSAFRGLGIGKRLLTEAVDFCKEKKFKNVFLLTTNMQDKALRMYKMMGFELTKSEEVQEWGKTFYEERYDLRLY